MYYPDKEVYYDKYCKTCKFYNLPESKDPCHDCLQYPKNYNSHKPVFWEEQTNQTKIDFK